MGLGDSTDLLLSPPELSFAAQLQQDTGHEPLSRDRNDICAIWEPHKGSWQLLFPFLRMLKAQ